MKVVLDASAAIRGVLGQPFGATVIDAVARASDVLAPGFFVAEVTNALWKYVVGQYLPVDAGVRAYETAANMVSTFRSSADLAEEAIREAARRRHPVYDMYYAVLARREAASVITFDRRLKTLLDQIGIATIATA